MKGDLTVNFGEVLTKAWQIIWKHKILWFFGILASIGSWGGNNINYSFSGTQSLEVPPAFQEFTRSPGEMAAWIFLGVIVLLLLIALVIFLNTIGRIALIRGSQAADSGSVRIIFGELFSGSLPYFWRVFLLNLLFGLAMAIVSILIILVMVFGSIATLFVGLICFIPLCCLLIPIGWAINIFLEQAIIAIVIENLGIIEGLSRGWKIFSTNLGTMIGMGLILWIISLVTGLIISIPLFVTLSPIIGAALWQTENLMEGALIFSIVCFCLYLPVLVLLLGILTSYVKSVWTLTYLRLTRLVYDIS